jgi:7,8-dihydroneopterin aldolase/epimerase/oxygenase
MGTVALEGLEFFAYHGFYEEEQKIGNRYTIDIQIVADLNEAATTDKLKATINYEVVYRIIAEVMQEPAKLLEHIGGQIIRQVRIQYPTVASVTVHVSKHNPPIGGVCQRARVSLEG